MRQNKIIIKNIILGSAAAVLFVALFGYGIYKMNWQSGFVYQLSRIVPYPAVLVDWEVIPVFTYLDEMRTLNKYWNTQRENPDVLLGIPDNGEIRERLIDKLIEEKIVQITARKKGIVITSDELEQEWLRLLARPNAENEVQLFLDNSYGWSEQKFQKRVLYPFLLQQKVSFALAQSAGNGEPDLKDKADEIYKLATAPGAVFSDLAKKRSQDEQSAARGGDLGYFSRGTFEPQVEEAIFNMKIGELSQPIRSSIGYHIIKLDDLLYDDNGNATQASARQILIKSFDFDKWIKEQKQKTAIYRLVR